MGIKYGRKNWISRIMAVFGYTTSAGTAFDTTDFIGSVFQAPDYGVITSIDFRVRAVTGTIKATCFLVQWGGVTPAGVFPANPYLVLQATSNEVTGITTADNVVNFTLPSGGGISAGTWYGLFGWATGALGTEQFRFNFDAAAANKSYNTGGNTYPTFPSPEFGGILSANVIQISANYTPRTPDNTTYKTIQGLSIAQGLGSIQGL